jgi:hypothetical protein
MVGSAKSRENSAFTTDITEINVELSENFRRYVTECCESSFISSIKGKVVSIMRRVYKSLERVPRGFGGWGTELAMFGRHFTSWGKRNRVKTLISRQISPKST